MSATLEADTTITARRAAEDTADNDIVIIIERAGKLTAALHDYGATTSDVGTSVDTKFYLAQSKVFAYPRSMDRLRLICLNLAGFDVFDGLVCTHWGGRHEVGTGTCQAFTNR